jgi:NAD-dependent DNA ligase
MATKSAEAFVSKITDFKDFLVKCGLENKLKLHENCNKKSVVQTHVLFGKSVILTGTRDKNIIEFLKNVGANQGSSVSKNTFLVISKNNAEGTENTGKIEDAKKLNIPIISVDEFTQTYL